MIDEATGKIAICSSEEVHIYKPYGKKEGALKARFGTHDSWPLREVLTKYVVVISVLFRGFKPRQRHVDTIMGVGGGAVDRVLFFEALQDCGRRCFDLESQSPQACQNSKLLLRR